MLLKKTGLLIAAMSVLLVGCSSDNKTASDTTTGTTTAATTGGAASGAKLKIAVIPKGSTHEFWKSVHEGAQKAGEELGVEIEWKGPLVESDRDSQIKVVEGFTTEGVNGIVLAPLDNKALVQPIENAVSQKIPVVVIDSGVDTTKIVSFVATDNEKGGQMAGDEMVRLLGGKGKIVMLRYQVGSASTDAREKGFEEAIKKAPGITIVDDKQYAGATTETAQKAAENLLSRFRKPDGSADIDGIYTPNESSTAGTLLVLQSNKWAGKVKFMGFDASAKLLDGLKAGEINGLIVQNPRNMGYLGVKTLVASIKGEKVETRIDTGATLVTKANMADPKVSELLAPPKN